MMRVSFDLRRSVPENAKVYYEKSKKLKGKIPGLEIAIADMRRKLESVSVIDEEKPQMVRKVERKWFEKFRWFVSSQSYLVIGGRDASTNDILVKKHMEGSDIVFHADVSGAPFFIVKNPEKGTVPDETRSEAATAAASYSKAWSRGAGSVDVYEVDPEQVSKTPPAGEYLTKGAFMVYGQKRWHRNVELKVAVGVLEGKIIGGPVDSIKAQTRRYVIVGLGDTPQGALARQVKAKLGDVELDDVQRFLPAGGGRLL
ncbi:MAG: NFACT RNA binding domain-containing protein [Candidatus Altiarchaeota archaeon]